MVLGANPDIGDRVEDAQSAEMEIEGCWVLLFVELYSRKGENVGIEVAGDGARLMVDLVAVDLSSEYKEWVTEVSVRRVVRGAVQVGCGPGCYLLLATVPAAHDRMWLVGDLVDCKAFDADLWPRRRGDGWLEDLGGHEES